MKLLVWGLVAVSLIQLSDCQYGRGRQPPPQKKKPNPYKILGISKDATPAQVKRAYRTLGLKYHPDKNKAKDAREKMQQINEAYEMISDPDAKLIYDEFGDTEKYYDRWSYMQSRRGQELAKKDFYTSSEDVLTMELKTFYQTVRAGPILVEFYAPWCVHCQEMVPKFKKAAVLLEGIVRLGAVNCEKHQQLCHQQNIQSYPSLLFFHPVKRGESQEVESFQGGHNPEEIYSWIQTSLSNELVKLNTDDFEKQVVESDDLWLVDFSAGPWCGPCTMLKPTLRRLASSMKGVSRVGIVNCDEERTLCGAFNVNFYPQVRLFKKDKTPTEGEPLSASDNAGPAEVAISIFEKVAKLLYVPPAKPAEEEEGEDNTADGARGEEDEDDIPIGDDDKAKDEL